MEMVMCYSLQEPIARWPIIHGVETTPYNVSLEETGLRNKEARPMFEDSLRVFLMSILIIISMGLAAAIVKVVAEHWGRTVGRRWFHLSKDDVRRNINSSSYFPNNT